MIPRHKRPVHLNVISLGDDRIGGWLRGPRVTSGSAPLLLPDAISPVGEVKIEEIAQFGAEQAAWLEGQLARHHAYRRQIAAKLARGALRFDAPEVAKAMYVNLVQPGQAAPRWEEPAVKTFYFTAGLPYPTLRDRQRRLLAEIDAEIAALNGKR